MRLLLSERSWRALKGWGSCRWPDRETTSTASSTRSTGWPLRATCPCYRYRMQGLTRPWRTQYYIIYHSDRVMRTCVYNCISLLFLWMICSQQQFYRTLNGTLLFTFYNQISSSSLIGTKASVTTHAVADGFFLHGVMSGDYLRTVHDKPQVSVILATLFLLMLQ